MMEVAKALFSKNKAKWEELSDDKKVKNFFIFNRYLSKKYLDKSRLVNQKNVNEIIAFDLWFYYLCSQPYPNWIWSKSDSYKIEISSKKNFDKKDYKLLLEKMSLKESDLNYLIKYHIDFVKEELKYYKALEKGN